jgi:hypothetical protein
LFLRSYYYFLLTQVFGDVPLVYQSDAARPTESAAHAESRGVRPDSGRLRSWQPHCCPSHPAASTGRATKGAAYALAAKAYLYEKKWEKWWNT